MTDPNLGWAAGVGFIVFIWGAYVLLVPIREKEEVEVTGKKKRDLCMTRFWEGADGRASFSKFQFWLWTFVIVLGLFATWIARVLVAKDVVSPIDEIPDSLLAVLGVSTVTSLGAKKITTAYVDESMTRKPTKKKPTPQEKRKGSKDPECHRVWTSLRELVVDDGGYPELAKLQMLTFTLATVIFFLITVGDTISNGVEKQMVLPDIDQSLLVLMGISAGGYLGKKLVTQERPTITAILPSDVPAGTTTAVMLTGRALGEKDIGVLRVGPQLYKEEREKETFEWSSSVISFDFDAKEIEPGNYPVEIVVGDTKSNREVLRVVKAKEASEGEGHDD